MFVSSVTVPLGTTASYVFTPAFPLLGKPPRNGVLVQLASTLHMPVLLRVETTSAASATRATSVKTMSKIAMTVKRGWKVWVFIMLGERKLIHCKGSRRSHHAKSKVRPLSQNTSGC